jgi:hypothetical protein
LTLAGAARHPAAVRPAIRSSSLAALLALTACGDDGPPAGALIDVAMDGRVGVLLDELPEEVRDRVADDLLARPASFWEDRARRQIEATLYRLVYRNFYGDDLGQLPLPPAELWSIELAAAARVEIDGHDLVAAPYTLTSTLLASNEQPGLADAALSQIGGVVEEPFVLPADPEHLLERTGYACMNESDFPPGSVDTENARAFYDDTCEGGLVEDGCHLTEPVPDDDCVEALEAAVGRVEATVRFERIRWDAARADEVRRGTPREGGPQLEALEAGVADHRVVYRYFDGDSCAIAEGCVGGAGWRRLLMFTATMQNVGDEDAVLGDVGEGSAIVANNMVSFSACHQHMHFNHYGRFAWGDDDQLGSKRAFCLESTSRYANNEATPLVHPYSCEFQGTAAGWGDDYIAGLDCQWIDVTTVDVGDAPTAALTFEVNPDGFLCEGALVRDDDGEPTFEDTDFETEAGDPERRFACEAFADAADDNVASVDVTLTAGGMVTEPCDRYLLGPTRNCGLEARGGVIACTAGEATTLSCAGGEADAPAVIRICEASAELGAIPCLHADARAVAIHEGASQDVTFTCPPMRSAAEPGGSVAVYVGALVDGDDVDDVACDAP